MSRLLVTILVLALGFAEISVDLNQPLVDDSQQAEQYEFQAEVASVMDIIINSLYINKQVFLRELISNASDAMDKIKYISLQDSEYTTGELEIRIKFDSEQKTLTIVDTGIGMTKNDLIEKLGTVAKTGTMQFIEAFSSGQDINQIGQFGVGFYSAFLVSNKIEVKSKHDNDDQYIWVSSAGPNFTVRKDPEGNTLIRGTEITLHLKQDAQEFLDQQTLQNTVQQYSQFINYPIFLYLQDDQWYERPMTQQEIFDQEEKEAIQKKRKEEQKQKEREEKQALGEEYVQEPEEPEQTPERVKKDTRKIWVWEQINAQKAIWLKEPEENKIKDYVRLYQTLKKDGSQPLYFIHFHGEGEVDFRCIIFIPDSPPSNMFQDYHSNVSGLRLYVRRVLIAQGPKELVPKYLNFLKGVINSDDMPLNVSRQTLQQKRIIKIISNKIVRKVLDTLLALANDQDEWVADKPNKQDFDYQSIESEKQRKQVEGEYQILLRWSGQKGKQRYEQFWEHFDKNIKLGVIQDSNNRSKLIKLLRFHTTKSQKELTSFEEYVQRMPQTQQYIYYLAGQDMKSLQKSPMIQSLQQIGFQVILLDDPLDEYSFSYIKDYKQKKLKNVVKGQLELMIMTAYEEKKEQKLKEMYQPLTDWWKDLLGKQVQKVALSRRLVDSPVVIRTGDSGYTANMYRIAKLQAYGNQQKIPQHQAPIQTLEINPNHPAIKNMLNLVQTNPSSDILPDYGWMYYQTALLSSGFSLTEDLDFSKRLYRLAMKRMGISESDPMKLPDVELEDLEVAPTDDYENLDLADVEVLDTEVVEELHPEGERVDL